MAINIAGGGNLYSKEPSCEQDSLELRKTLEAACRQNGFRRLELESCHFIHADRGFTNELFKQTSQKCDGYRVNSMIDTETGSITLYEANV